MSKSKKIFYAAIFVLAVMCLTVTFGSCYMQSFETNVAFAASVVDLQTLNESATSSDTKSGIGSITEYPDHYMQNYLVEAKAYKVVGDDPIVKIIPKDNFRTSNTNVFIGKEYGFFINMVEEFENYKVFDVMVFDVKSSYYLPETADTITVTVSPLYQYRYAYILNTTGYLYYFGSQVALDYQYSEADCVVPMPNEEGVLNQIHRYYLKDICFGGVLRNEQNYNVSDESYSPYKDDGSFFIETDYKYNALYRRQKSFMEYIDKEFILNCINVTLGLAGLVPELEKVAGALGLFISGSQLAYKAIGMINAATGEAIDMVNVDNGQYTATCLYTTRDGQLANCIGEDGNLGLTKAATLEVQGDDDTGNFWYGVGNYAEAIFRVSNSSVNADDWQTRLTQDIRLTVVDEEGKEYGVNELNGHKVTQNAHEFVINDPVYEHIDIGAKKELRILPDGNNYFTMKARFTGYFNFEFEKDNDYDIYVNDEKVVKVNDEYQIYMTSDKTYDIRIFSNVGGIVGFRLMPLRANAKLECKQPNNVYAYYCDKTGTYTIKSEDRAILKELYSMLDDGSLTSQPINFNQILFEGNWYLIVLRSEEGIDDKVGCDVIEDKEPKLALNTIYELDYRNQKVFYEFDCQLDGNYTVQLTDLISTYNKPEFSMVDEFGNTYLPNEFVTNGAKFYGLDEGTKYYIGIKSDKCKMSLLFDSKNYVWKQKVNGSWKALNTYSVDLARGLSVEFSLWIDGVMQTDYHIVASSSQGIWDDGNLISLPTTFRHGDHIFLYAYKDRGIGLFYPVPLAIQGVINTDEFEMSVDYKDRLSVTWAWPQDVFGINMKVKKGTTVLAQQYFSSSSTPYWDIMRALWDVNALNAKLYFDYYISSKNYLTYDAGLDLHLYFEKDGIFYKIYNALLLSYLRYDQSETLYVLDNDITIPYPWTPIPVLEKNKIFSGVNRKITGLTLEVDDSLSSWGLFSKLEGGVANLTLENVKITSKATTSDWMAVGALCGVNYTQIYKVNLVRTSNEYTLDCQKTNCCFGGLTGYAGAGVQTSSVSGYEITGSGEMGAIAGYYVAQSDTSKIDKCIVENCTINYRYISEARRIGGIVGYSLNGNISNCQVNNTVMRIINSSQIRDTVAMGYYVGAMDNGTVYAPISISGCSHDIGIVHTNYRKYLFNGTDGYYGRR